MGLNFSYFIKTHHTNKIFIFLRYGKTTLETHKEIMEFGKTLEQPQAKLKVGRKVGL